MTLCKILFLRVWGTLLIVWECIVNAKYHSHHHNCALPNYGGIVAIRFGIIQRIGNWSFFSFNNHGSTVIFKNRKMEEDIPYPIKLPIAITMSTFFSTSEGQKLNIRYYTRNI